MCVCMCDGGSGEMSPTDELDAHMQLCSEIRQSRAADQQRLRVLVSCPGVTPATLRAGIVFKVC